MAYQEKILKDRLKHEYPNKNGYIEDVSPQCSQDGVLFSADRVQFTPLPSYNDVIQPLHNDPTSDTKKCGKMSKWIAIAVVILAVCLLFAILGSVYMVHIYSPASSKTEQEQLTDTGVCTNNVCLYGGTCFNSEASFLCKCAPGFTGIHCEINTNECLSSPCRRGATCSDGVDSYTCLCKQGYTGDTCNQEIEECSSSPCENGGTCIEQFSGYSCTCEDGYEGHHCEIDADECASNPCHNQGTCEDRRASFLCHCTDDFTGALCQTGVLDTCPGDFVLLADTGRCYYFNDMSTVPWAEAEAACESMDAELASFETEHEMMVVGWKIRYQSVLYYVSARRMGMFQSFYWKSSAPVRDIKWWANEPKLSKKCVAFWNTWFSNTSSLVSTSCDSDTQRYVCERDFINVCQRNPCLNGATCRDGIGHSCVCAPGYTGHLCETDINECASDPCLHGGTCQDEVDGYTCTCVGNLIGTHCEIDPNVRCPENYILYREASRCYYIEDSHDRQLSWSDAHEMCEHLGGSLASLETVSELQYVGAHISWEGRYHILSGRRERDGLFYWSTGTVLDEAHSEWASQEPRANKDCSSVITRGGEYKLYSVECTEPRPYICERGPLV